MESRRSVFDQDGVLLVEGVVPSREVEVLLGLCETLLATGDRRRPGVRRALQLSPGLIDALRRTAVPELMKELGGAGCQVVRSIVFDKSPESNWMVPWHQDATIAVVDRVDDSRFGPWSVKDGEQHCRPPRELLDRTLVIRIHLDRCDPDNGPLKVIPRSHADGLFPSSRIDQLVARGPVKECCVGAGGVVVMRPHTVHASDRAVRPDRRRVLHLECTNAQLPSGMRWAEASQL
jgi:ectoine hydroxylase-related dioxygenase (phytanoyl-CoA dioxygenase family)